MTTIENSSAVQRDTAKTFLVDVDFQIFDPSPLGITATVEYAFSALGPWNPATSQTFDRKHSVPNPVVPINTASPGSLFTFVWNAFFDVVDINRDDVFIRLTIDNSVAVTQVSTVIGPISVITQQDSKTEDVALSNQLKRRALVENTPFDFLGNGLVIPFRRGTRDFVSDSGIELIRSTVRQILGTRAAVGNFAGELQWRPDLGSKLWVLRHRKNDETLRDQAETFVREALLFEPRVQVNDVFVEREPYAEPNELLIRVFYEIIEENIGTNRVILPEFEERIVLQAA